VCIANNFQKQHQTQNVAKNQDGFRPVRCVGGLDVVEATMEYFCGVEARAL
jgi:hypothetical protein